MLLCFSIRTKTRQWGWPVELWTDSPALTSWLNLSAAQCSSSAVQLLPSLCPRASSHTLGHQPHVPAWVGTLPHCSLMCHQFVTRDRRGLPVPAASFLLPTSVHGCCPGSWALSLRVCGGKIAPPYRSHPRRGECRLRKCQVPLACSFQISFCTVPTQLSPHRAWEPCHQSISPVCLLTELSRMQEKLILLRLSWAV